MANKKHTNNPIKVFRPEETTPKQKLNVKEKFYKFT